MSLVFFYLRFLSLYILDGAGASASFGHFYEFEFVYVCMRNTRLAF